MKPYRAIVLTIGLAVCYLFGTAASLYSAWEAGPQHFWGRVALVAAAVLVLMLGAPLLCMLWPVLRTNARHVLLVTAIRDVGMVDVESRNEGDRHLPPEAVYSRPDLRELVVTGITAASSLRNHMDLIKRRLTDKADVYFLICSERTVGLERVADIERRNVASEIQEVRDVITRERLLFDERFHIRCFSRLPTFTAVMINGDLVPRQAPPQDSKGVIRIQPRRMEFTHHDGIVLEFANTGSRIDGFNIFAADLRKQWELAEHWK